MNNIPGNIQKFEKGTEVEIRAYKIGFKIGTLHIVVEEDKEYNLLLEQELLPTPVYNNLRIVEDN